MQTTTAREPSGDSLSPYQLFMLAICLWAILSLAADTVFVLDTEKSRVLGYADNVLCVLFFLDFLKNLSRAPKPLTYFVSWGWLDLLSSIPTVDVLRWGRTARTVRILRVLRGVKAARKISHFLVARRAQSAFLVTMLIALLLVVFSAIAMLEFETTADSTIRTAEDALWWAMSTMTTVGYGDTYPRTAEGRLVAVFLMAAGVGLFGTFSGLLAAWFLSPTAKEADADVKGLDVDIRELKAMVTELQGRLPPSAVRAESHRRANCRCLPGSDGPSRSPGDSHGVPSPRSNGPDGAEWRVSGGTDGRAGRAEMA